MKKLLTAIIIATSCTNANALASIRHIHTHQSSYNIGYNAGKNHAYNNVMKTVAIVWIATVAGVIIYHAGKESRWGANENGITYRF